PAYVFKKNDLFRIVKLLYQEKNAGEKHLSDAVKIAIAKYNFKVSGLIIQNQAFDLGRPYPYMAAQRNFFKNLDDDSLHRLAKEWESRGDNHSSD
nr:hypothetical protein [Candidatus Sigynarchaeota archaeon]